MHLANPLRFAALALAATLASCTPVALVNGLVPRSRASGALQAGARWANAAAIVCRRLLVERRQHTTGSPCARAVSRKLRITLWPRKSVKSVSAGLIFTQFGRFEFIDEMCRAARG